ncbi:hypothetical protein QT383_19750 [Stenotrophomonas rhizophila]
MPNPDTTAITGQLERYEQALNSSDVDAVMRLYSDDAVFMPQHSLPVAGAGVPDLPISRSSRPSG